MRVVCIPFVVSSFDFPGPRSCVAQLLCRKFVISSSASYTFQLVKLVRRLIYFSTAFVLTSGALLAFFHHMGLFYVNGIPVEVAGGADSPVMRNSPGAGPELQSRIKETVRRFDKLKIWEVNLGDLKAAIVKDEWVKDVHISRAFPNELRVMVKPREPVLVLLTNSSSSVSSASGHGADVPSMLPITEDGRLLSALPADALPDVPLLRGDGFATDVKLREKAVRFISLLPESGLVSRKNVSEVSWTPEEGFSLTLINPKVEVKLGEERIELKVMRVSQVLNYLSNNHLKGRVVDASFSKKVLVRLRKGP